MDIDVLIKSLLGKDGQLIEEAQEKIKVAFDQQVLKSSEEKVELVREALDKEHSKLIDVLLEKNNLDHDAKLELLKEKIDNDHYNRAKETFVKLDESYSQKLKKVKEHYESGLFLEQKEFANTLIDSIDRFLTEEVITPFFPTEKLEEVAKVRHSQRILKEARDLLGVDDALSNDSIREAVADGGKQITELKTELNKVVEEKRQLEVKNFLAEQVSGFSKEKVDYLTESLQDKDLDFVKRNFSFAEKDFEKQIDDKRQSTLRQINEDVEEVETHNDDQLLTEDQNNKKNTPETMVSQWAALAVQEN